MTRVRDHAELRTRDRPEHLDGMLRRDDVAVADDEQRGRFDALRGGMLLVDPSSGKAITITLWESEDALHASADQANQARQQAAEGARMTVNSVESYEVAMEFET